MGKLLIGSPRQTISLLQEEIKRRNPTKLFAIGDIVSLNALKNGIQVDYIIIDFKNRRQAIEPLCLDNFKVVKVKNPAGVITVEAYEAVKKICQRSCTTAIVVDGEEDLLTLPVIRFAPLGAFVIYGQPYVGIVLVIVTEKIKLEADLLMEKMGKLG